MYDPRLSLLICSVDEMNFDDLEQPIYELEDWSSNNHGLPEEEATIESKLPSVIPEPPTVLCYIGVRVK